MPNKKRKDIGKIPATPAPPSEKQRTGSDLGTPTTTQTKTKRQSGVVAATTPRQTGGTTSGSTQPRNVIAQNVAALNVAGKQTAQQSKAAAQEKAKADAAEEAARRTRVITAKTELAGLADPAFDGDFLDAGDLPDYADQHDAAVASLDAILEKAKVTAADADQAERLVQELDAARADLQQRAEDAKQESDDLRTEIGEKVEALPDPGDLTSVEVYLDDGDLKALRDANDAVRKAVTKRTTAKRVTEADRDATARQVQKQQDAAAELGVKAAGAKAESDSFRTEIGKRATDLPDLLTGVKANADYLDAAEIAAFEKSHTDTAAALKTATEATRIMKKARDDAIKRATDLSDRATELAKQAAEAKVLSDGYRAKLQQNVQDLDALRAKVESWAPFLDDAKRTAFAQKHDECVPELNTAAGVTWVRKTAYAAAATTFADAQKAGADLVAEARAAMETRKNTELQAVQAIRGRIKHEPRFDISELNRLNKEMTDAVTAGNWAVVDAKLDAMREESAKLNTYLDGLDGWTERISKLPEMIEKTKLDKVKMRADLFTPFQTAVLAKPRNDDQVIQLLERMNDELQSKEDLIGKRAEQRAAGLISAKGKVIKERTRATVGANPVERGRVVEALSALRNDSLDHSWAAKWGVKHANVEGNLPGLRGLGGYKEYYVRPVPGGANILRLAKHNTNDWVYYSSNHYGHAGPGDPWVKVTDA
jgi:hypothetical protein